MLTGWCAPSSSSAGAASGHESGGRGGAARSGGHGGGNIREKAPPSDGDREVASELAANAHVDAEIADYQKRLLKMMHGGKRRRRRLRR